MSTTARRPAPSTDRPTATYPTADHLAHLDRLADLWADATPTAELPVVGRPAARQARSSRALRHLRAALAGVLAASALLTGLSLYAADGISSARSQAAQPAQPAPQQASPATDTDTDTDADQPDWVIHGTDSPYDRTDPAASPLDLPRCTTSPSTPLPCLATISPGSRHVTVLEEDASLTGLDLRQHAIRRRP